jgi:hypothetical protein
VRGAPTTTCFPEAIVTPFVHGKFEGGTVPAANWHTGAVHDRDGWLVPQSRRIGGIGGDGFIATDPELVADGRGGIGARGAAPVDLPGTWYYGGYWFGHFGHWLLETFPGLWAHRGEDVLFHPFASNTVQQPYQKRLLELAGITASPRFVDSALRVESLVVPARQSAVNGFVDVAGVALFQRVAAKVRSSSRRQRLVWLSRSKLKPEKGALVGPDRMIANERALDEVFAEHGCEVVHPQELEIDEQIRVVREARLIAGVEGSALHLSLFAQPGLHVLVLGSARRPNGNYGQRVVDAAAGHHQALVPFKGDDEGGLDLRHVRKSVRALLQDLAPAPPRITSGWRRSPRPLGS